MSSALDDLLTRYQAIRDGDVRKAAQDPRPSPSKSRPEWQNT